MRQALNQSPFSRSRLMQSGRPDNFQTPATALTPLLPHIPCEWRIWEPACGRMNLVRGFQKAGYQTIGTDIEGGYDFLSWEPDWYDCLITNPPFSIKDRFLQRAYALGKPFAFLLPVTTLGGKRNQRMFAEHGIQIIFMPKRVDFETPSGKDGGSWFSTAWFCSGLNLPDSLNFWTPARPQIDFDFETEGVLL